MNTPSHLQPESATRPIPRRIGLRFLLSLAGLLLPLLLARPALAQDPTLLTTYPAWFSDEQDRSQSLAWGDVDGDGDLDLAVGNAAFSGIDPSGAPNRVYLNEEGVLQTSAAWSSADADDTSSLAWGDMDGDGDLDLAVGNWGGSSKVYLNAGGILQTTAVWSSNTEESTTSVAWGDVNGDGSLDLALGHYSGPIEIYLNTGQMLQTAPAWSFGAGSGIFSLAWGDMDGDGDLDLAVGYDLAADEVYLNENGVMQTTPAWTSNETNSTASLAWGDMDGDGDLDLATGNGGPSLIAEPNKVYLNDGQMLQRSAVWTSGEADNTYGVAWGDADGDGDLDLAVGNEFGLNKIYLNESGMLQTSVAWTSSNPHDVRGIAWGDVDGDGDLELAVANDIGSNKIYLNLGSVLRPTAVLVSNDTDETTSIAWGDVDGDGDLDLAVGNYSQFDSDGLNLIGVENKIYLNEGGTLQPLAAWASQDQDFTTSVAWGDMDGDNDLDLAVGNSAQEIYDSSCQCYITVGKNRVYLNEGGMLQNIASWSSTDTDNTSSIAWGDVDGDGDLDLAVGNSGTNKVYLNQNGVLQNTASWSSGDSDSTSSVAWGDVDGDGDLDLAVGNSGTNKVYLNQNGVLQNTASWSSGDSDSTSSVAWGDVDGDGDLDLAVGNSGTNNKVYLNHNGLLQSMAAWTSGDEDWTTSLAWGDVDGDGDLDLAVGNYAQSDEAGNIVVGENKIYLNQNGRLQQVADNPWITSEQDNTGYVAWGDADGDGNLDLAVGNTQVYDSNCGCSVGGETKIYLNGRQGGQILPNNSPFLRLMSPGFTPKANLYASAEILDRGTATLTYTLYDPEGDPVGGVAGFYSLDGGDNWRSATAADGTITTNLATGPYPTVTMTNTHVFTWDIFASGIFGQSDNVVFRLVAYPQPNQSASFGTYLYPNNTPGPIQRPYASATTFPFRVRGTQVQVFSGTRGTGHELADALVYRLPAGKTTDGFALSNASGETYRTDGQGYLRGRGEIGLGDQLVALWPVPLPPTLTTRYSDTVQLYYMSASPTETGLAGLIYSPLANTPTLSVTQPGVQQLLVSSANPLLLFNLDISLEWDARQDTAFLEQLEFDLKRTSELLFDASDGQAALGDLTIYHDKTRWAEADIRIYARNNLNPNADVGGLNDQPVGEIITAGEPYTLTYSPGAIRIGAVWNRFGEPTGALGEDWPRTLVHELGHYLFYLHENYIGLNTEGVVIPLPEPGCQGSLMTDQYRDDYTEFFPDDDQRWADECGGTISARRSGRSDWQTIKTWYPWLNQPTTPQTINPGPAVLPLAVTRIQIKALDAPQLPLEIPYFALVDRQGAKPNPLPDQRAQAILYQGDHLVDLGQPSLDTVIARGAHAGDRLCLYDLANKRLGCETVSGDKLTLTLVEQPQWQPDIRITPITSRTVVITITQAPANVELQSRFYPDDGPATLSTTLTPVDAAGGVYSTIFDLPQPAIAGYIQLWVQEPEERRREIITNYALGGSPGYEKKRPKSRQAAKAEGAGGNLTPAISPDGQVLIYGQAEFERGAFYALQKATYLPAPPPGRTIVGQGYYLLASMSPQAPPLEETSLSFRYLGRDVPSGEETFLSLYHWTGHEWLKLPKLERNPTYNEVSAPTLGAGLYALMSSLEIPLYQAGWNLIAYPVQETRPVTEALRSIEDAYSTVYGYVVTDTVDPWQVYGVDAPDWVNDLKTLNFGQGYWINVTQPTTLLLQGASAREAQSMPNPPATYYGAVLLDDPAEGMPVVAKVNDQACGRAVTQRQMLDGVEQVVYAIDVKGAGQEAGCGQPGQRVTFEVGKQAMGSYEFWNNNQVWRLDLSLMPGLPPSLDKRLYLPLIFRP